MEEKNRKKFELNTKLLDNFDAIMATKLDEIDELKITGLDTGSKLLNIVSLCANVKTLIIEGDPRINSDRVLSNIFKPENLENLVLNNVKIPTPDALKRYENLKMISLNDIRFCSIKEFLGGIPNPEKMEIIHISNTDMQNLSIGNLERFSNFKYLNLDHVQNCKLDDLEFLRKNNHLLKIDILENKIPVTQINHLLKCKCTKNVVLEVTDSEGKTISNCFLEIDGQNKPILTVLAQDLEAISKKANLFKLGMINLKFNCLVEQQPCIKLLKRLKKQVNVSVKDISCLSVEQAKKLKECLNINKIKVLENGKWIEYDIDTYMENRSQVDEIIRSIETNLSEPEKFLQIYQALGTQVKISQNSNAKNEITSIKEASQILQNCLECVNIKSNIITGEELENEQKHAWNQVKLEGKWYHVDLGLDLENIKKGKTEYCLLGDKNFLQTHIPKAGKNHYCAEDFNPKLVHVFFKTGLLNEKLVASYFQVLIEKIKKLLNFNKPKKALSLPEGQMQDKGNEG